MGTAVRRSQRNHRRSLRERGQSTLELGMILPLFLLLIIGVVEINNALDAYITVVSASRDGARLGSKGAATTASIQALVQKDLGRLHNTTPASNITITYPTVSSMNAVKVVACYDYSSLLLSNLVLPSSYHMCATTTMPKLN